MKSGVKLAKNSAKTAIKTNVNAAKGLAKVSKDGAKTALKNGKMAVTGLKKGALKGVKKVDDMGQFLAKKFASHLSNVAECVAAGNTWRGNLASRGSRVPGIDDNRIRIGLAFFLKNRVPLRPGTGQTAENKRQKKVSP